MTQEAPQESWGFNDPGDEGGSQRTGMDSVQDFFPGAQVEIKVDLKNVTSPDPEKVQRLGHGLADSQGVKVTVWTDRSNFSVYKPGSEGSTE